MKSDMKVKADTMSCETANIEEDYRPHLPIPETTHFIPETRIEIIRNHRMQHPPEHVVFDFDGTLSLVREGWIPVMTGMMVEILQDTGTDESADTLEALITEFILRLNGKQTIYQMIQLSEEVAKRGGSPRSPMEYKQLYHDRLMMRIQHRREALRSGTLAPASLLVPHATDFLQTLKARKVQLYLASGTDESYVVEEARLLGLDVYFGRYIFGAVDDYRTFSKRKVIEKILHDHHVDGSRLAGFGDGYVEIENIKTAGGVAVAVASDEAGRSGRPDPWKRERLIRVGADIVIPDYQDYRELVNLLWPDGD